MTDITKCTCGKVDHLAKYCPACGRQLFCAPRSENEMKAEMENVMSMVNAGNSPGEGVMNILVSILITQTLAWASGNDTKSPSELLKARFGKSSVRKDKPQFSD